MKVPNALNRDDTVHGVYYYLASEVDAALAERDAEIVKRDRMWDQLNEQTGLELAAQRKVLATALEALKLARGMHYTVSIPSEKAIKAIQGVLK